MVSLSFYSSSSVCMVYLFFFSFFVFFYGFSCFMFYLFVPLSFLSWCIDLWMFNEIWVLYFILYQIWVFFLWEIYKFVLYSIHVICPKNNQISVTVICHTIIWYPILRVDRYAPLSDWLRCCTYSMRISPYPIANAVKSSPINFVSFFF